MDTEYLKLIKEFGYGIGYFGLCIWLVKTIVTNLCGKIDLLANGLSALISKTEEWNRESVSAHSHQKEEHKEMIQCLKK